jgi:hypothetical protein
MDDHHRVRQQKEDKEPDQRDRCNADNEPDDAAGKRGQGSKPARVAKRL